MLPLTAEDTADPAERDPPDLAVLGDAKDAHDEGCAHSVQRRDADAVGHDVGNLQEAVPEENHSCGCARGHMLTVVSEGQSGVRKPCLSRTCCSDLCRRDAVP